jgi:hypothetical protein
MPILYSFFGHSMPVVWSQPAQSLSERNTKGMMRNMPFRKGCESGGNELWRRRRNYEPPTRMLLTGMWTSLTM